MIKVQNLTPSVYYDKSRDFQFIGRLYDAVLNSVKTDADAIYSLRHTGKNNNKLLDLLAMTLGFRAKHNYNSEQLIAVCSILPDILRHKGSLAAIKLTGNAILNSIGSTDTFDAEVDNNGILQVYIPEGNSDMALFNDILEYIIPAGTKCAITRGVLIKQATTTKVYVNMSVTNKAKADEQVAAVVNQDTADINYEALSAYSDITGFIQNNVIVQGEPITQKTDDTATS